MASCASHVRSGGRRARPGNASSGPKAGVRGVRSYAREHGGRDAVRRLIAYSGSCGSRRRSATNPGRRAFPGLVIDDCDAAVVEPIDRSSRTRACGAISANSRRCSTAATRNARAACRARSVRSSAARAAHVRARRCLERCPHVAECSSSARFYGRRNVHALSVNSACAGKCEEQLERAMRHDAAQPRRKPSASGSGARAPSRS